MSDSVIYFQFTVTFVQYISFQKSLWLNRSKSRPYAFLYMFVHFMATNSRSFLMQDLWHNRKTIQITVFPSFFLGTCWFPPIMHSKSSCIIGIVFIKLWWKYFVVFYIKLLGKKKDMSGSMPQQSKRIIPCHHWTQSLALQEICNNDWFGQELWVLFA